MSSAIVTEVHTRKVRLESNISGDRLKNEQKTVISVIILETAADREEYAAHRRVAAESVK